jgi:choline dehydrogenase-like flavoprotein
MSTSIPDPIKLGLARGWRVHGGLHRAMPDTLTCDVAIIGSGAGAGVTAELLTQAGLNVVIVEEGPLKSSSDFKQLESEAYPTLYQENAARKTADKAIQILQGRCVGGSTTVNWTSSFRTPSKTLAYWRDALGLADFDEDALSPWFLGAEQRMSVTPWLVPPNENNDILRRGALQMGITAPAILRNVKGCWNLGSCGMGCPTNAKQSMLVTTIPAALDAGATLFVQSRAERLELQGGRATAVTVVEVGGDGSRANTTSTRLVAKHIVVAGGAINSPALLMRSQAPDPHGLLGTRTFLHPVVMSAARFKQDVQGWQGAPQTIYSDHYLDLHATDGPIGYKLEAPPLHPLIFATSMSGYGQAMSAKLKAFPNTHALIALMRDGFHAQSIGGRVKLRGDGSAVLDYPLTEYVMDGARRAFWSMAELQFAAGAQEVMVGHELAGSATSWAQARETINRLPMKPLLTKVVSAHVMGGCALGVKPERGVVQPNGTHWQLDNVSVLDGSIFPTSIGANPQLSVYGITHRLAAGLAKRLTGRDVALTAAPSVANSNNAKAGS